MPLMSVPYAYSIDDIHSNFQEKTYISGLTYVRQGKVQNIAFDSNGRLSARVTPEERKGLIPTYITLKHELNEAEQRNIIAAELWAFNLSRV
jgi:hypothetical protein